MGGSEERGGHFGYFQTLSKTAAYGAKLIIVSYLSH